MNSELETLVSMETSTVVHDEASQEINSLLRAGIDAAKNGKRDEAKALLFRVTDLEPESEMAWLWLASVSEYPEELLTFLQKVLSINPGNEQALEWEGSTKALLARNLVQYGITAVQENKKESAKRCFNRALETDENNEMAWLWLASIADDADEKVVSLKKVLTINPENEVANTLLKLLRRDEAQELLHQSKKFAVKGNRQEALEMLEQVKQLDANLDEVWVLQAHLSDSFEEKAFCFNQALACNPDNDAAQAGLRSIEPLLHVLNNPTQALSPELLQQIEAGSEMVASELEAANEEILVEDSEEVMASSFSEEEAYAETETATETTSAPSLYEAAEEENSADMYSDETIDTGELYFEDRSETEETILFTRVDDEVTEEDEVTEQATETAETFEAAQASHFEEEAVAATDNFAGQSFVDEHTTEDNAVEEAAAVETESNSENGYHFAENSFASLFQNENGREANGHETNGHVSEEQSDENQFAETLFEAEAKTENFDPASLIDEDDSEDEPDFHFQPMADVSHSDNGFHHESFVPHEGTASPYSFSEPASENLETLEEAERSYAPGQLYAPVEDSVEDSFEEEARVEEVSSQEQVTAQTFYFGSDNATENEAVSEEETSEFHNEEHVEENKFSFSENSFDQKSEEVEENPSVEEVAEEAQRHYVFQTEENAEIAEPEKAHEEFYVEQAEEAAEAQVAEAAEATKTFETVTDSVETSEVENAAVEGEQSYSQGVACPFCDTDNNINDEVCGGCHAVLGLHNMDMLMSRENTNGQALSDSVAQMESELEAKDSVSAEEYFNLGLACLNMKDFDKGLKYLQKSYILNPTNSFLKTQIDELTKRMGKMNTMEEFVVETAVAGKTIMVVDDSATIRKLVSAKLEKHGHNVVMAVDGMDALAKLEEMIPDLILLDITMPRLDGYQVCKLIRANDNTRFVPVVLISGKDGFFDKVRGKMCGSTSYITKPFGPEMLLRTVEGYFN